MDFPWLETTSMPTDTSPVLLTGGRALEWPSRGLDVTALRSAGWRPTPFRDVVLKVHQRCNLACDYCYVYEMADQSWRTRPLVIEDHICEATAARMVEHARTHELGSMRLVLHGGEPLLAGAARLDRLIRIFRDALDGVTRLTVQMQTNGVLLSPDILELLHGHRVGIGVSLDGTAADHDRRRRRPDGRGSYTAVDRALRLLTEGRYRDSFAGLLCTVDPTTDPCRMPTGRRRPTARRRPVRRRTPTGSSPSSTAGMTPPVRRFRFACSRTCSRSRWAEPDGPSRPA
jgi:uncharacterized protein